MPYAIQALEVGKPRQLRRWHTIATARRLAVAEKILASVRQDRLHVQTLTRLKPFNGHLSRAYSLAGEA